MLDHLVTYVPFGSPMSMRSRDVLGVVSITWVESASQTRAATLGLQSRLVALSVVLWQLCPGLGAHVVTSSPAGS